MQTNIQDELTIKQRLNAPMPKFFRIIRNGGIILAAVAGALMGIQSQGVELPQVLTVVADKAYALAGLVATLIAQLTVDVEATKKQNAL